MKPLSAGSEIDAWCTRCRMDLGHRIVAMVGSAPKRVICQTCNSEHNFRALHGNKAAASVQVRGKATANDKPAGPASAGARVGLKARAENERYEGWATRTLGRTNDAFTRYSMDRTFRPGELVLHPKFGEGYVEQVLEGGKVNVMFREGARVLAHRVG